MEVKRHWVDNTPPGSQPLKLRCQEKKQQEDSQELEWASHGDNIQHDGWYMLRRSADKKE